MPDSICRLTVAACTEDTHRSVDLAVPTGIHIGQLLPQIVDIVHDGTARSMSGTDWRLSRLGDHPMDESMTLADNDVRDGEVLLLTTAEPPPAARVDCDPCRAMTADTSAASEPVLRTLAAICCVLLGGCGAIALAWPVAAIGTTGRIVTGACVAVSAAMGAAVVCHRHGDSLVCVPLSLTAVLYASATGFVAVPPGPVPSGPLLAASAAFSAAILMLRVTGCGGTLLIAIATLSALVTTVAAAAVIWTLQLAAGGAALATLSLAILGFAPRISMVLSGVGRSTHQTLTGLVVGAAIAAALGSATVAAGLALRDAAFTAVVALALLLRVRTHVDQTRRVGLAAASALTATAGLAAVAATVPAQAHVVSVVAASVGAATLGCLGRPAVSPIVLRTVEVVEYLALAAIVPSACWVSGIYGLARGMNLL